MLSVVNVLNVSSKCFFIGMTIVYQIMSVHDQSMMAVKVVFTDAMPELVQ
jgi:hypothetical protein